MTGTFEQSLVDNTFLLTVHREAVKAESVPHAVESEHKNTSVVFL
jgi:hypothetical protein